MPIRWLTISRLDQLCLDIPPDLFEAECSFWHELTNWSFRQGVLAEFRYLERPPGLPVRLPLQRRAHARSGDEVSAHIDFAAQDAAALADTHVAGNARIQRHSLTGSPWTIPSDAPTA